MTIRTTWQALDHVKRYLLMDQYPEHKVTSFSVTALFSHTCIHIHSPIDRIKYTVGVVFAKRKEKSTIQGKFLTEQIVEYRKALMLNVRVC